MTGHRIIHGDCTAALIQLARDGFLADSVCTDPPYHLASIVARFGGQGAAEAQVGATGAYRRAAQGFMGQQWDGGDVAFRPDTWRRVYDVLKPGAYLVAFAATKGYHRMACAIEDAGFEIRDMIAWLYGSGFCKSHNLRNQPLCECHDDQEKSEHSVRPMPDADLSEAKHDGDEHGEVLQPVMPEQGTSKHWATGEESEPRNGEKPCMEGWELHRAEQGVSHGSEARPSTGEAERICARAYSGSGEEAGEAVAAGGRGASHRSGQSEQRPEESEGVCEPPRALDDGALPVGSVCSRCGKLSPHWEGWGTALKPAIEPIVFAQKPISESSVAANVARWGVGALNIDASRIHADDAQGGTYKVKRFAPGADVNKTGGWKQDASFTGEMKPGRWPANVCHDGSPEVLEAFAQFGERGAAAPVHTRNAPMFGSVYQHYEAPIMNPGATFQGDTGTAARFFYSSKATQGERIFECRECGAHTVGKPGCGHDDLRTHPTVKPLSLMQWLVRMVTPPGGLVLDPFAGTGTTAHAAREAGMQSLSIEADENHVRDIGVRLGVPVADLIAAEVSAAPADSGSQGDMFL